MIVAEKVVVVRHGQYDERGHLTPQAIRNVTKLSLLIKNYLGPEKILVYSSLVSRAYETAKIISVELGLREPEKTACLGYEDKSGLLVDFDGTYAVNCMAGILEIMANLVIVTHFHCAATIAHALLGVRNGLRVEVNSAGALGVDVGAFRRGEKVEYIKYLR